MTYKKIPTTILKNSAGVGGIKYPLKTATNLYQTTDMQVKTNPDKNILRLSCKVTKEQLSSTKQNILKSGGTVVKYLLLVIARLTGYTEGIQSRSESTKHNWSERQFLRCMKPRLQSYPLGSKLH